MNSAMGQMSGLVIIAALLLDLSLLPVLMFLVERKVDKSQQEIKPSFPGTINS